MAQTAKDTTGTEKILAKADSLYALEEYHSTIKDLKERVNLYTSSNLWEKAVKIHNKISEGYLLQSKDEFAKKHIDLSFEILDEKLKVLVLEKANTYSNLGQFYSNQTKLDSALSSYDRALKIRKKLLSWDNEQIARSYLDFIPDLVVRGEYKKALMYLDSVKFIYDNNPSENIMNLVDYHVDFGSINSIIGKNGEAIRSTENAIAILEAQPAKNTRKYVETLLRQFYNYYNARDFEKSLALSLKVVPMYREIVGTDNLKMIRVYNNTARLYNRLGEPLKALEYNEKALKIARKHYGENGLKVSQGYEVKGLIYASSTDKSKLKEGIIYYKKSAEIITSQLGEVYKDLIYIYGNIGYLYEQLGQYENAITYLSKSLEVGKSIFGEDNVLISPSLINLGFAKSKNGEKEEALSAFKRALQLRISAYGEQHKDVITAYLSLGQFYQENTQFETAIKYYNKALTVLGDDFEKLLDNKYGPIYFQEMTDMFDAILGKAEIYRNEFQNMQNMDKLKKSAMEYKKADVLSMKIRQKITSEYDRLTLAETSRRLFDGAIETHDLLFTKTGNLSELENMIYYSERSRASTLIENIAPRKNEDTKGLSSALALEKKLNDDRAVLISKIYPNYESDSISDSIAVNKDRLFKINSSYDSLLYEIQKQNPAYFSVNFDERGANVKEIQERLDSNTGIIEFYAHANGNFYVFFISKATTQVKKIKIENLRNKITFFNKAIIEKNTINFKKLSSQLYNTLIEPNLNEFKGSELIIIPDESLWGLEFDLLLTKKTSTNNPKELPFLLRDYAISYANSIVLLEAYSKNRKNTKDCLAFSYTDLNDPRGGSSIDLSRLRDTKSDLPGTRKEIREIANIIDGEYYYGSNAIEANFKAKANDFSILHLALHGEVNHIKPEFSRLYFTQQKDSIEDNYLYAHELTTLDLPADLAVLSACDTGSGKNLVGEGIMSLGSAFQYAGTKSLLLSKWEVSDATTPDIMLYFYENLKKGMKKSKALQQAKLRFLASASGNQVQPYYWGSFFVLGSNKPIEFENRLSWYWALLLLPIGIIGYFAYNRKKVA